MLARSVGRPLSWDFLTQGYSGHFFPGGFLFAWFHANHTPLELVGRHRAARAAAGRLLRRALARGDPDRRTRLGARAGAGVLRALPADPDLHPVVGGRHPVPAGHAVLAARGVGVPAGWRDDGRRGWWVLVVGRSSGAALPGAGRARAPAGLPRRRHARRRDGLAARLWGTTRRAWPLWVACAVVVLGYLVLHRALVPITATRTVPPVTSPSSATWSSATRSRGCGAARCGRG